MVSAQRRIPRVQPYAWLTRLRNHWLIALVVLAGTVMRGLMMVAYAPALLFPDSWGYISIAFHSPFVGVPRLRPVGYSVLIRLLTLPDRSLAELVAFQHLAVTGAGVAIYVVLTRTRLPRWAAAAAAALVLLDGYSMTLEQYVMSDTFFTVLLLLAALLVTWPQIQGRARWSARELRWRSLLAGLTLAFTALVREALPFVLPVFVVYLTWIRIGWRPLVAFLLAALLPLLAYSALIDARYHVFGLTTASGWVLYGRAASFASCTGIQLPAVERPLCETAAQRSSHPSAPDWYIWGPSPANLEFHPNTETNLQAAHTNSVLESFAKTMILHHPLAYAKTSLEAFANYFAPGVMPYGNSVSATSLPSSARAEAHSSQTQRQDLPGLKLHVRPPAGFMRSYRDIIHVPRPLLGLLAITSLLALCLRVPWRREILLFSGSGTLLLLGTAATGGLSLRYLMPAVPLLAIGGTLALAQLLARVYRPVARKSTPV
ncbi:MAG: phospholipid carrier-dependent glycosyltransferase [Solirubrobacteraceae bacterium]